MKLWTGEYPRKRGYNKLDGLHMPCGRIVAQRLADDIAKLIADYTNRNAEGR